MMGIINHANRLVLLFLCAGALLWQNSASAQGGMSYQVGGYDFGPTAANPSAIFWNPAALGMMPPGTHVLVDIEAVAGKGLYERAPDVNSAFYPEVEATVLFPIPFIGVVDNFDLEDWRFGFAVYMPFGSGGQWDALGPQRFHLIKGAEASIFVTTTATYKVTPNFFVGGGVSYVFSVLQGEVSLDLITTVQSLVQGLLTSIPTESPLFEANARTGYMTAHDVTFNGGFFYQPVPFIDLGISFLLPIEVNFSGPVDVTLPDVLNLGQPVLASIGLDGSTVRADGEITVTRPPMIASGMSWRTGAGAILDTVFVYSFNSFRDTFKTELFGTGLPYLDAPEGTSIRNTGADNAILVRTGAKYPMSPELLIGGYLTYIESGIPSTHVTASNIGFNMLIPTLFSQYTFDEVDKVGFSVSPIFTFTRNVQNSVFDSTLPASSGLGVPTGNGTYRGFGIQLGLSYTRSF